MATANEPVEDRHHQGVGGDGRESAEDGRRDGVRPGVELSVEGLGGRVVRT